MPDASCPVALVRGIPVALAPARINPVNARLLLAALLHSADCGHATLVVDLTRTESCEAAALPILVRAHQRAVAEGGELRLAVTAPAVLRILSVTGLDRVLRRFASVTDAVAELPAIRILPSRFAEASGWRSSTSALRSGLPAL